MWMKTKITIENKELNNLVEHSIKLSLIKLLLIKGEITEKEFYKLKDVIKREHFPLKT